MANQQSDDPLAIGNVDGLSGLLSAVLAQTSAIQAADNAVDSKANNLMAGALVVLALLATQLRNDNGQWQLWAIASMLVQILTVCLVISLTKPRNGAGAVVDLATHQEYFGMDDEFLLMQLIEDADSANRSNLHDLATKTRLLKWASSIFLFGFALAIVSLFVFV